MADQQQPQQQEMNVVCADSLDLPPGFRFHPTDYEIVSHYLAKKVHDVDFTYTAFEEVDLIKTEPWNLPIKAKWGENEWYFFYQKDRKYPSGLRANRATKAGYWKATGKDKEVYNSIEGVGPLIGMKKTLVFYEGRAPRSNKTNWVMHEYRLEGSGKLPGPASASCPATNTVAAMKASTSAFKDEWVVCRVFEKATGIKKMIAPAYQVGLVDAEIDQNQNNVSTIPIPMPLQLPLPVPMPKQFPILPDFATDPVPPYYPNGGAGMLSMMPRMAGIGDVDGFQNNGALFNNPIAASPQMNFYHQMDMGAAANQMDVGVEVDQMGMGAAVAQMEIGAADIGGLDVAMSKSRPPSMVSEQANAAEISPMMSMTDPRFATTTTEMDVIWKYKY